MQSNRLWFPLWFFSLSLFLILLILPLARQGMFLDGVLYAAIAKNLAFPNMVRELWKNQDFFGNQIFLKSDPVEKQTWDMARYVMKSMAPPLVGDAISVGYKEGKPIPSKYKKMTEEFSREEAEQGRYGRRTTEQSLLGYTGFKINPFDLESQAGYSERDKIKALQTLLEERGEINMGRYFYTKEEKTP